jgi:hypothetical protein
LKDNNLEYLKKILELLKDLRERDYLKDLIESEPTCD